MNTKELIKQIQTKKTYLCVGLDTDPKKIPVHLQGSKHGVLQFNKQIIDATKDHCVSYKLNTAFYEAQGKQGWEIMEETLDYIPKTHFSIADAKRGDIGNTSAAYAKTFFELMAFDSITVAPYMGEDSIRPFLEYTDKVTIVLGLTSNIGSQDFEMLRLQDGSYVYEKVIQKTALWGNPENLMFVIGATQADFFSSIRKLIPDHFLLVPGVGAQGGNLQEVSNHGLNKNAGLLVNASRAILYASQNEDFAEVAKSVAAAYHKEMNECLIARERGGAAE